MRPERCWPLTVGVLCPARCPTLVATAHGVSRSHPRRTRSGQVSGRVGLVDPTPQERASPPEGCEAHSVAHHQ